MEHSSISGSTTIRINELIYYIYFLCLFGSRAVGLYDGQKLYNAFLVLGAGFFVIKICTTRHTLAEYIGSFALLFIAGLTYIFSGEKGLLIYFTMMLGMKGIAKEKVIRTGLYVLGISYFILYFLSVTGLITELNHMNKRSGYGFLMRHSLGYPYPNTAHTTFLILVILFFYLYKSESTIKLIKASVIAMLLNLYIYVYTVSLTGLISVTIYLLVNFYLQKRTGRSKIESVLILLLFPAVVIFSIAGPLLAKGDIFSFMNKLLHKRYEYALYFLTNEKVTPFGSYFKAPPTNWYMLDNSFLYLFLQLGVISFIAVCIIYILWIKNLIDEDQRPELAVMITFCFIGMSDPFLFNLSYKNITFIFIGSWLFSEFEKRSDNLPKLLRKDFILLPIGEKELTFNTGSLAKIKSVTSKTFIKTGKSFIAYTIIFAAALFIGYAAYTGTHTEPKILYVDSKIADPYFSHSNIEMTMQDVNTALAEGNLVEGYDEEDPTMYVFKKKAPHMEYIRSALTCGVFSGLILVLLISIIGAFRKG